jgi:hypothetical protein
LAELHQDALKIYANIPEADQGVAVVLERASCKAKLGLYGDSIKDLDIILFSLIDLYASGNEIPEIIRNISEASYSKENAVRAFVDIATLAQVAGAELFMVSGTLLGFGFWFNRLIQASVAGRVGVEIGFILYQSNLP